MATTIEGSAYMDYASVLESVVRWARSEANVRAVVLTGSAAAGSQHPLSDRDVELHVRDTTPLEAVDEWWNRLGNVLVVERLENDEDQPTRLVYYEGGKIDFTLIAIEDASGNYGRPFTVLLDKDDISSRWQVVEPPPELPDQTMFNECVNWAYAAAIMTATAVARDEPWAAKLRDGDLKAELLRMIEWDHNVRYGSARDVRFLGTRMRQWMDRDIQQRLEHCWGGFALGDAGRALNSSLELFESVTSRVARHGSLADFRHRTVRDEVNSILAGRADAVE